MSVLNWGFWKLVVPTVLWLERHSASGALFKPCRDVTQILSRSLDEPLPLRERWVVRLHFLYCRWCASYGKQLQNLRHLARRLGDPSEAELSDEVQLSPEAKQRILAKMTEADQGPKA